MTKRTFESNAAYAHRHNNRNGSMTTRRAKQASSRRNRRQWKRDRLKLQLEDYYEHCEIGTG